MDIPHLITSVSLETNIKSKYMKFSSHMYALFHAREVCTDLCMWPEHLLIRMKVQQLDESDLMVCIWLSQSLCVCPSAQAVWEAQISSVYLIAGSTAPRRPRWPAPKSRRIVVLRFSSLPSSFLFSTAVCFLTPTHVFQPPQSLRLLSQTRGLQALCQRAIYFSALCAEECEAGRKRAKQWFLEQTGFKRTVFFLKYVHLFSVVIGSAGTNGLSDHGSWVHDRSSLGLD